MPIYYPPGTIAKIVGDDSTEDQVQIGGFNQKSGKKYDLGDGEFDITVTMGAANNTKREEATEAIMELIRAVPAITPMIYDIFIGNMDFPGAQAIADRLKKTIPAELLEEAGGEQEMAMKIQQATTQLKQDQEIIQALQQQMQQLSMELQTKGMENKTKLEIAQIDANTKIAVANIKALEDQNREATKLSQFWYQQINKQQPQQNQPERNMNGY